MQFHIQNMTCGGCARSVTKAIQGVDPNAKVEPNPATRQVKVETTASQTQIRQALANAGYPAATT